MKDILVIARRELSSYFTGPIGYIYLIVFLALTNFLGIMAFQFFAHPVADMRSYFQVLVAMSVFFIAAVTMRLWAEERKENTFEMLLTFPMKSWHLVGGKYLASMFFYGLAVVGTFTVPWMMASLSRLKAGMPGAEAVSAWGLLDPGPVVWGYLGVMLVGSIFISFGLFISGFCRDQIVAFVITAPALLVSYLLGIPHIRSVVDANMGFLGYEKVGTAAGKFIGVYTHFEGLAKGLVTGADILFFVIWTGIFLLLNVLGLERRGRKNANLNYALAIVLLAVAGSIMNLTLMDGSVNLGRFDKTQDKLYTVSPASKTILGDLSDDVQVTYYTSPRDKMPDQLQSLQRDVIDRLESLKQVSGKRLRVNIVDTLDPTNVMENPFAKEKDGKKKKKKTREEELMERGVIPFPVGEQNEDRSSMQYIYSSIEIAYREHESKLIPIVHPQALGSALEKLEYEIVSKVDRMTRESKPIVAMVAPRSTMPPQLAALYRQMGRPDRDPYAGAHQFLSQKGYDVKRIELSQKEPLPEKYDVLLVMGMKELNLRQQFEISRAIALGKPTFIAAQKYSWQYQREQGGMAITKKAEKPELNPILAPIGVTLNDEVLMDRNAVPLVMGRSLQEQMNPYRLPMHILVPSGGMNRKSPITRRLSELLYLWGSALEVNADLLAKNKITATTLMSSSVNSWTRSVDKMLRPEDVDDRGKAVKASLQAYPLAMLLEGTFSYAFAGKPVPAWPPQPPSGRRPPQPPPAPDTDAGKPFTLDDAKPGKLILVGCASMFADQSGFSPQTDNAGLLLNGLDKLALGEKGMAILALRDKTARRRTITKPSPADQKTWRIINFGALLALIGAVGIAVSIVRTVRRTRYNEMNA